MGVDVNFFPSYVVLFTNPNMRHQMSHLHKQFLQRNQTPRNQISSQTRPKTSLPTNPKISEHQRQSITSHAILAKDKTGKRGEISTRTQIQFTPTPT